MRRLERHQCLTTARRVGMRIAAVAAAILILIVVGDGILNREWLSGSSTDDEQQCAIQGKILDPGLVGKVLRQTMIPLWIV